MKVEEALLSEAVVYINMRSDLNDLQHSTQNTRRGPQRSKVNNQVVQTMRLEPLTFCKDTTDLSDVMLLFFSEFHWFERIASQINFVCDFWFVSRRKSKVC